MKQNGSDKLTPKNPSNRNNETPRHPNNQTGQTPKKPENWTNTGKGIKHKKKGR